MRFFLIITFFMISFSLFSAEKELGVQIPGVRIEGDHFKSTANIHQVIKYLKKHGIRSFSRTEFDAPGLRVVNLKSTSSRTKWESINVYNDSRYTYIYIVPRK